MACMQHGARGRRAIGRASLSAALVSVAACAGRIDAARDPFALGVASGYPSPDGFVIWTRLAPEPLAPDGAGGMSPAAMEVAWEVAEDPRFERIARRGVATAEAAWAHSLHVEVGGLGAGRPYWYRFVADGRASPVGRAATAPSPGAAAARLRFAFASCQHYEQGWFVAHRHMAAEELDLVVFLGDYIYESSWGRDHVRAHEAGEPATLAAYRRRHALYRSDIDLQASHAACPWLVTWDDHEVDNDYADDRSEDLWPRERFLARRAAAYRAFYEHMPLPPSMRPSGPDMRIHARLDWGALARIHVLDDRQYRSHQACPRPGRGGSNTVGASCAERLDPALTMLGGAQERWLDEGFASSGARWNVIAQQTLVARLARQSGGEARVWTDGWDGYPAARARLLDSLVARRASNPLVVGGDVHAWYAADLRRDFDDPRGAIVASEVCGSSITSQGPSHARLATLAPLNPHLRFADGATRGYAVATLARGGAEVALRTVETVKRADAGISTLARIGIEDGRPGVHVSGAA
jgi:alkaline phosphatase D